MTAHCATVRNTPTARELTTNGSTLNDVVANLRLCASAACKPVPLTKRGVPVNANDWTEQDWMDLHRAMERVIRKIAKRHHQTSLR